MKNLKVKAKLLVGFLIILVLAVAVGICGIISLTTAGDSITLLNDRQEQTVFNARTNQNVIMIRADIRGVAMSLLDFNKESIETYMEDMEASKAAALQNMADTKALLRDEQAIAIFAQIESNWNSFVAADDKFIEEINSINLDTFTTLSEAERQAIIDETMLIINEAAETAVPLQESVASLTERLVVICDEQVADSNSSVTMWTIIIFSVLGLAAVLAIVLMLYISSLISTPLTKMMGWLKQAGETGNLKFGDEEWALCDKLSAGKDEIGQSINAFNVFMRKVVYYGEELTRVSNSDLTVQVEKLSENDTIGSALENMISSLNSIFNEITSSAGQVNSGSQQIANGAQSLAAGATQQASSVEELSNSINDIATSIKHAAEAARHASEVANDARGKAEKGSQQMSEMMKAVNDINEASQNISRVIKVIDDIAFQTNILALNAAVEAARAGSAGKGFAVVAEEVRNLAAKSSEAAKETGSLIAASINQAQLGVKIAGETNDSLRDIVEGIVESNKISIDIAKNSEEQSEAIGQVNIGIEQVSQVVQQNSATAEESAAASEELSGQAAMLSQLIAQFNLKDSSKFSLPSESQSHASGKLPKESESGYGKY
ncbi:MAG: methyl-accepting chemotaxis protein [Oscillospiraceae bacterium]|nr:methyl-accepting chemotaxis protein [Oscillospiraceae bacterium]